MLAVVFGFVVLGLLPDRLRRHQTLMIVGFASVMTALYWMFPWRFL